MADYNFDSTIPTGTTNVKQDNINSRQNELILQNNFKGVSAPSNPVEGQDWYDTTNKQMKRYDGSVWQDIDLNSKVYKDVLGSYGSLNSLEQRLAVSIADDGTLKTGVAENISEFKSTGYTFTFISANSFTVPSDVTNIFVQGIAIEAMTATSTPSYSYSHVKSSSYANDVTTVTLYDSILDSTLEDVRYGILYNGLPYQTNNANLQIEESTGYGVVSGFNYSFDATPGMNVYISAGIIHMQNGNRYSINANNFVIPTADAINPRIDLIYINSTGIITYLTGISSVTPVVPTLPNGGFSLNNVNVAANATTGVITDTRIFKSRYQNQGDINIVDNNTVIGDAINDDTVAIQAIIDNNLNMGNMFTTLFDGNFKSGRKIKINGNNNPLQVNQSKMKLKELSFRNFGSGECIHIIGDTSQDEFSTLTKYVNTWERLVINGAGNGIGIYVGDKSSGAPTLTSGAQFSLRDSHLYWMNQAIVLGENCHSCSFENLIISAMQVSCIDINNVAGATNSGEATVFNNCRFFHNNGPIILGHLIEIGCDIIFNNCSFDYSIKAIDISGTGAVYRGGSVICNNCYFETNTTYTPDEYIRVADSANLTLNNCHFVLSGDWSNKNFIVNSHGFVAINGGYLHYDGYTIAYKKPRLILDISSAISADGISKIKGLNFRTPQSLVALGESSNLIPTNPFSGISITNAAYVTTDSSVKYNGLNTLKIVGDGASTQGFGITFPCRAGNIVIPYWVQKLTGVTQGSLEVNLLQTRVTFNSTNGTNLQDAYSRFSGTIDWVKSNEASGFDYYACRAPQGTATVTLAITMESCTGVVNIADLGLWIV